jgi:hypothetical protein
MTPVPTSKAREPRDNTETGPPVSGRADTDAEAEALADAEAVGLAVGLASSPKLTSGRSLA